MFARRIRFTNRLLALGFLGFFTYITANKAASHPPQPPTLPLMAGAPTAAANQS